MSTNQSLKERISAGAALIDDWLSYQCYIKELPGFSVGVFAEDETVFAKSYGYADVENRLPASPSTMYRIASHSKLFTATAIMLLYSRDQLSLDDRVSKYLPWFTSDTDENIRHIRIRQLLTHSSGMVRDGETAHWLTFDFPDAGRLREQVKAGSATTFESSEHLKYSNFAYSIAGMIIEAISGMPYQAFVQREILDPLEMRDTRSDYQPEDEAAHAVGYGPRFPGERRERLPHIEAKGMASATGFSSTAADLIRFYRAHLFGNDELLPDRDKREMQRLQYQDRTVNWGIGFRRTSYDGVEVAGHGGGYPGFITLSGIDQTRKLIVVVLTNATDGPAMPLLSGLIGMIKTLEEKWDSLTPQESIAPEQIRPLTGFYRDPWGVDLYGVVRGRLVTIPPGSPSPSESMQIFDHVKGTSFRHPTVLQLGSMGEELVFEASERDGEFDIVHGGERTRRWRW